MKLTTRQWKTYNAIKEATKKGGTISRRELYLLQPKDYVWNDNSKSHDNCVAIRTDVDAINESEEIEKIVVYDSKGNFKLAENAEEAYDFLYRVYCKVAVEKFRKMRLIKQKMSANGQGKLISTKGDVIDEKSKAREYVETYCRVDI